MLNEHDAGPEQINITVVTRDFLNRLFKARYDATANTEDIEEFVPERLLLCLLALDACPFLGKGDRAVPDFVPGKRHRSMIAGERRDQRSRSLKFARKLRADVQEVPAAVFERLVDQDAGECLGFGHDGKCDYNASGQKKCIVACY